MIRPREEVYQGVFDRLSASADYKFKDRKVWTFDDIPQSKRPAIMMHEPRELYREQPNLGLPLTTLEVQFVIYTWAKNAKTPVSILNPLLDAIDKLLAPEPMTNRQTLGGLVYHVWIEGEIIKVAGDLDGDGLALVPVHILVP